MKVECQDTKTLATLKNVLLLYGCISIGVVLMKRSEKIEIRVSTEEKQALADIASQEGRPVSRLVRDVLGKYITLNAPTSKPQMHPRPFGKPKARTASRYL